MFTVLNTVHSVKRYDGAMAKKKKTTTRKPTKKKSTPKKSAPKKKATAKKSAPKKSAPKKATPKKKAKKRAVQKAKAAAHKPRVRRDATGHLDPSYARDLRRKSRENAEHDDDRGFLVGARRDDALAQELGREFVETVTSGEDEGVELRDEFVTEEAGGPFVTTTIGQEVAEEPDESNPLGATREPFPKT
jgi:hypothetical protein